MNSELLLLDKNHKDTLIEKQKQNHKKRLNSK